MDSQGQTEIAMVPNLLEPKKSQQRQSGRRKWVLGIGAVFVLIVVGLICLGKGTVQWTTDPWSIHYWPAVPDDLNTWIFGGPEGQTPVTVPFTQENGLIYVQGSINKIPVTFFVDTGASDNCLPADLHVGGRQYMDDGITVDGAGNTATSHPLLFDHATIGGCAIRDFTAGVEQSPMLRDIKANFAPVKITLGNTALAQIVLTIDYRRHVLVFSPPTSPHAITPSVKRGVYHFAWQAQDSETSSSGPVLHGHCAGRPLTILIDTGATGAAISPQLASELQRIKPADFAVRRKTGVFQTTFGVQDGDMLDPFYFTLDCPHGQAYNLNGAAVIERGLTGTSKVVLGAHALSKQIITIDYPNRTVTLTPYQ